MSKNTVQVPTRTATAYSCPIVSTPSRCASGIDPSAAARIRSWAIRTPRNRIRSTHAPAGRPITRKAAVSQAVSNPTANVLACRLRIATSGSANWLIIVPNWLTVSPIHNRRKSR
jgi:hypothetical protein